MTKSDLIAALAAKEKLTEKMATDTIKPIFNGFADTLKKGSRIFNTDQGSQFTKQDRGIQTCCLIYFLEEYSALKNWRLTFEYFI